MRTNAVPLEVSQLRGECVQVGVWIGEHERVEQLVEHADQEMGHQHRPDRRSDQPRLLEAAIAGGEKIDSRTPEIREALLEARIDRRRLLQDHGCRVAVVGKQAEPAAEARPEQGLWVEKDLFFALEVEVEGAARDAGASCPDYRLTRQSSQGRYRDSANGRLTSEQSADRALRRPHRA